MNSYKQPTKLIEKEMRFVIKTGVGAEGGGIDEMKVVKIQTSSYEINKS